MEAPAGVLSPTIAAAAATATERRRHFHDPTSDNPRGDQEHAYKKGWLHSREGDERPKPTVAGAETWGFEINWASNTSMSAAVVHLKLPPRSATSGTGVARLAALHQLPELPGRS